MLFHRTISGDVRLDPVERRLIRRGWEQDVFGLWTPPETPAGLLAGSGPRFEQLEFHVRKQYGFEIRQDSVRVFDQDLNGWREADWQEAARIRSGWIDAIGPEIARIAGVEPE